jgi:methyl-accepting chemotaxis protein
MPSNEETMRLNAELSLARFSPQAKQMVKDLAEIKKATDEAHSPAAKVAKLHAKAYQELRERISGTAETIRGVLSPAMAGLGIAGFGVTESITKVIEGLKDAAKQYYLMQDASKRSGMSADHISSISVQFERLGLTAGQALSSVSEFGEHMDKFARNSPREREKWAGAYADVIDQLGNKMKGNSAVPRSSPARNATRF